MKRSNAIYKYYFIEPRSNSDSDGLASKLASLEPVEEVLLTEGDFGFIVKARSEREHGVVEACLSKMEVKYYKAESHVGYKR